ncbi:hypothetical protein [Desulfovibrio sp. X2]|uniref:hypothetical protein n=1 Tax=Desulfovibrio sp. X2 TaxID=941449 RepID=UPI001267FE05|nr:hypothetical protein [Desulfovibrio sp. X2]
MTTRTPLTSLLAALRPVAVLCAACLLLGAVPLVALAEQAAWTSPDGRYGAAFPGAPTAVDAAPGGLQGTSYVYVRKSGVAARFILSAITEPSLAQLSGSDARRAALESAVRSFAATLGVDEKDLQLDWDVFPGFGPRCLYDFVHRSRSGKTLLRIVGFEIIDGDRLVDVNVTVRSDYDYAGDAQIRAFLGNFKVFVSEAEYKPLLDAVAATAARVPLAETACPADLARDMASIASGNGYLQVGLRCYASSSSVADVTRALDGAGNGGRAEVRPGTWHDAFANGKERTDVVGDKGILWFVWPLAELDWPGLPQGTRSVVVAQPVQ